MMFPSFAGLKVFSGLIAVAGVVVASHASAAEPPPGWVGSIHGLVLAEVHENGALTDMAAPDANVKVRNASGAIVGEASTNLAGIFASPLLPAGSYRVCAGAVGFVETCSSDPVTLVDASKALREPIAMTAQAGALHGRVTLKDGSPAARMAIGAGTTAAAAQVGLAEAGGRVIAGPASVNISGDYVLAPVVPGSDLTVTAKYEGASAAQTLTLTPEELRLGRRIDLTLGSAPPNITGVTMTSNGQPISSAAPGSAIGLTVTADNPGGTGPLHYRWTTSSGEAVGTTSPTLAWRLPSGAGANVLFLEITNGEGGVTRTSITIPMAVKSAVEGAQAARLNAAQPNALNIPINFPIPILCPIFIYCPPAHNGNFIDPTLLMNGACSDETSCETEATAYYQSIGALDANKQPTQTGTFKGWKAAHGFGADPTSPASGEVRATYYNNADLQFGRDMHCRANSTFFQTAVACYVSNYGANGKTFGSDPQGAVSNASANSGRIATVAMTYVFNRLIVIPGGGGAPPQDYRVQFYVFGPSLNGDANDGSLATAAALDSQGAKATPGICLDCHGGQYDPTLHKAKDSNFLPFDAPSFIFSSNLRFFTEDAERELIRQLNGFVREATYARPTVSQLIDGWYGWCGGVNAGSCYIDDVGHPFYPTQACPSGAQSDVSCGWPTTWGGASAQSVYQRVPRLYCRTCHVAQANFLNVDSFSDWSGNASFIKQIVLASSGGEHNFMPFAQVPYDGFWHDFQAQSALAAFLNATGP